MTRLQYPLSHEWHAAVNRHSDELRKAKKKWSDMRFMYDAETMADEVPRMVILFKQERESALPQTHQQCSMQAPVPVKDNHLSCCKGVKTRDCPHLLALDKIERCTPEDIDTTKAWTCAAHIVSTGGDVMNEGYLLRVNDRMFWDNVHASLAAGMEEEPAQPTSNAELLSLAEAIEPRHGKMLLRKPHQRAADLLRAIADQRPVAWVIHCDEIGDDGKPTRLRDLDWCESEIEHLPVGTKLYAGRDPS